MPPGSISNPIPVGGGYSIVAMIDKRKVLTSDPRDATLALKQISIAFKPGTSAEQAQPTVNAFAAGLKTLGGCGKVADFAAQMKAAVIDNDAVKIRDLPPALATDHAADARGRGDPAVRIFGGRVCAAWWSAAATIRPTPPCLRSRRWQNQITDERVNLRARRYLRDLRRDAVIDYR